MSFNQFSVIADTAGSTLSRKLTSALRRQAWEAGWPADVARRLSITHEAGTYHVDYDPSLEIAVQDLEFGTTAQPPSPVIRRFLNRIDDHSDSFDRELNAYLSKMDVLL